MGSAIRTTFVLVLGAWVCCWCLTSWAYGVPERTEDNLIVASYNIKWMGQYPHDYSKLAQVIQHFDVCGIVEVKKESAVRELVAALKTATGKDWGFIYGIRTHRPHGTYHEAYAFVWRRDRVQLGDGVVSNVWDLEEAFRNDPYIASFKRKSFDFSILLVHTRWGTDPEGSRAHEVAMVANQLLWMRGFLREKDFIVAGDFNYSGTAAPMKAMATEADLTQVDKNEKSTFKGDFSGYKSSYDHIYLSRYALGEYVQGSSEVLDSTALVYGDHEVDHMQASQHDISDHLPVWAEFDVTKPDDD